MTAFSPQQVHDQFEKMVAEQLRADRETYERHWEREEAKRRAAAHRAVEPPEPTL